MRRAHLAGMIAAAACAHPPPAPAPAPVAPSPQPPTPWSPAANPRDAARLPLADAIIAAHPDYDGFDEAIVARWSPDGRRILFGSPRDGTPEIYLGDPSAPAAAPVALTHGPEPVSAAQFTRDGAAIVFTRDHGGDENFEIWRADADGGHPTNLTPGPPLHRGEPMLPRTRADIMLYSAASTAAPDTTLYAQPLAGGAPIAVYTQPAPGALMAITPDGARALMAGFRGDDDIVLTEVDVRTRAARQVYPEPGRKAGLYSAIYVGDGSRIAIATDLDRAVTVRLLDTATGRELARYVDAIPTAAVSLLGSPTGDTIAVLADAGNHGELRIVDGASLALRKTVALPLASVDLGAFRPDGGAFSIALSSPEAPANIFAVDTATAAITPLRADPQPSLASLPTLDVSIETAHAFDGLALPINVYLPRGARDAHRSLPTIISFHGGPSSSYAVRWNAFVRMFVALGYAVIEPNVRGSTGFGAAFEMADNREKRADWLRDVETVNAWAKAQPWCDRERVVALGGSYGGYTVLMALTRQPALWRAGIDLFGPADLDSFLRTTDAEVRAGFIPEFGDVDNDRELIAKFSPMRDVDRIAAPLFVYAGAHDPLVPRGQSDRIVGALRARHVPVTYMVAPDEGHGVDRDDTRRELMVRIAGFLDDALK